MPCPSCGYTALVISAAPPPNREDGEPARWGAALVGCMAVSGLVLVCALALARLAEAAEPAEQALVEGSLEGPCEVTAPVCVDPTLWAAER